MYGLRSNLALSLLAVLCGAALVSPAAASQRHAPRKVAKQEAIAPATPDLTPPAPLTLQEMPASPPEVTYEAGRLTIVSQNSTLGDILRAVHVKTGAQVEFPGNVTERVVGRMGPGPANQVLAQLLHGTNFNYIILGSATDASKVEKLILTRKPPETPAGATSAPVAASAPPPAESAADANAEDQDNDDASQSSESQPSPEQQTPPQSPVRTPEQLLQELQHQQQQQQQQPQEQPQRERDQ